MISLPLTSIGWARPTLQGEAMNLAAMKLTIPQARRWPRPLSLALLHSASSLAAMAAISLALVGCGKPVSSRTPVYKASGKISFEGQVPEGALVVLHPKNASSPTALRPTAHVQPDGTFQLTTYETGDGAPVGDYVVTVSWQRAVQQ